MPKYAISATLDGHGHRNRRLQDADNDTWIDVENTPNADEIRLTVAGVLRGLFSTTAIALTPGNAGITIEAQAGDETPFLLTIQNAQALSQDAILMDVLYNPNITAASTLQKILQIGGGPTLSGAGTTLRGLDFSVAISGGTTAVTPIYMAPLITGGTQTFMRGIHLLKGAVWTPAAASVAATMIDLADWGHSAWDTIYPLRIAAISAGTIRNPIRQEGTAIQEQNILAATVQLFSTVVSVGGGRGVLGIADATTAPTSSPAGGGILYSSAGFLRWVNSGGVDAILSPQQAAVTAVNGNNNNLVIDRAGLVRITGPTAAFTITGIAGGYAGRKVTIYNSTGQNMSFTDEDANSTAANRIRTMIGLAETSVGESTATLEYDATAARWVLTGLRY